MIGRIFGIVAALILAGWLYWLTARVQVLLTHAEAALDRADRTLAAAMAMVAATPPIATQLSAVAAPREEAPAIPALTAASMTSPAPAPVTVPSPADGPPTVPTGMAVEAEKRALVERAFSVHGAPRRFTFKASNNGDA
ncbi:hypothetical protein FHU33_4096 [Blastococcus colisei]|uniref:Uncharacterized protein n=1 Tax=Blastococcus colisei TaxID=1564162 RepID=A0A543P025_9ACTN|nr:hypothetical protein [Blastococcus colisei]TQN37444.1 hypothetical protein FHU33_4096 [Blastococcus colisei]